MRRNLLYSLFILIAIFIVFFTIALFQNDKAEKQKEAKKSTEEHQTQDNDKARDNGKKNKEKVVWGVDSSERVNQELYQCVNDNFGKPEVWARYLGDREGASYGLDQSEVELLHDNDISILLIYNHLNQATGKEQGKEAAEHAISLAQDTNAPEGSAIFVDIEPNYPIDSEFIQTWYETMKSSPYKPAMYGVFKKNSKIVEALNDTGSEVKENLIIWNSYPQKEITTKEKAPSFEQEGVDGVNQLGWQYGLDAEECNIDTNLFKASILKQTWQKE